MTISYNRKDTGWSWLICFGAFVVYFLESGLVKCLGVLLPALRAEFQTHTWVIGLIISLMPGYGAVTCKYVSPACKTRMWAYIIRNEIYHF